RMAVVGRKILRLAGYELLYTADVPPKVAINEAIEIAKKFGTKEAGRVINGLLARIHKELRPTFFACPARYAVLSDIHANLEALEAVLADAAPRTDALLCLGDLVGYGADPVACIEIVGARAQTLVCGNHEQAVAGLIDLDWFNGHARAAAVWTRE